MEVVNEEQDGMPSVEISDIQELHGIGLGSLIQLIKIDPLTNLATSQHAALHGTLSQNTIQKGQKVYVRFSQNHHEDSTNIIVNIDKMTDGTHWLRTKSGSVYRLVIHVLVAGTPETSGEASPVISNQRWTVKWMLKKLLGLGE